MKITTGNKSHMPMLFLTSNCNLLPGIIYMYLLVLLNKHWSVIYEKLQEWYLAMGYLKGSGINKHLENTSS